MKKLISVILALVLCLSAASALAATPSSQTEDTIVIVIDGEIKITLDYKSPKVDELLKAIGNDVFDPLVSVYEGENFNATERASVLMGVEPKDLDTKELVGIKFEGPVDNNVAIKLSAASFKAGDKLIITIGVPAENAENGFEWYGLIETPTIVNENGQAVVSFPSTLLGMIQGDANCVLAVIGTK